MATIIHSPKRKQETSPAAISQQTTGKNLWETEPSSLGGQVKQRSAQTQRKQTSSLWQPMKTPKEFSRSHTSSWYSGDTPTASEMIARADALYGNDKVRHDEVLSKIYTRMATPGSGVYNPYRTATNSGLIDNLTALGIDTSGGINDDFFAANAGYQKYLRRSAVSGTPSAPTKQSTNEERAAYYLYQLQKDEATTSEAETEWADMQKEISYWVGKGYSDDEVLAKVNADGKYTTLKKMDDAAGMGAPMALNRAVGYSRDAQYGAIWAARNGGGSGDAFQDSVSYASGIGKRYNADKTLEARRDVTSKDYMPYADGSTLDDANMYFGVSSFDQDWINANKGLLNGTDSTAAKYFKQVYQAEQTTQEAEQERAGVYAWIDAMQRQGMSADKISDLLQSMYDDPSSTDAVHMSTLKKMDEGRRSGDPVALTRSVDWRLEDALAYVRGGRTAETGATGRQNAAKLGRALTQPAGQEQPQAEAAPAATAQGGNSPTLSNDEMVAAFAAQKAEDETPTTAETGEAAEDVREQSEAEALRSQLVEEYHGLQHSAEVRGYGLTERMDAIREEVSTLTEQIGDNFTLNRPYTDDEAEAVLTKVYAGTEELTEDEQKIFSSFFADYGGLFGTAGGSDGGYRNYDSALLYGSKAMEALTWTDSPEATTRDGVQTIMQIVKDSQSAELAGLSLDDWYAENPDAEARLMQAKDNVLASREAKAEAQKQQAEQQRQQQLAYNVHVLQQVASGEALDETDQAAYDRIMQMDAKQLLATDAGYAARIDALYEDTAPRAFAEKMGLSDDQQEYAPFVADIVEDYYATDAKLAASVGLTLDELYAQYPALQKSEDAVIEQARQDYFTRWSEPADGTPEGEGLGFFKTLALGADSGWNSWVSGKIGFYQAITTHDDETVAQDNYDVYVRTYGIAGARRAYSNDVASAIYAMADDDPMKAVYAQQFADAQRNGTDIFQLPFNFTAETLRQARQKFDANVQANADLVNEYGTWAEKCLLYPVSSSVVSNSLNLAESAAVTGLTGIPTLGTVAGYGLQQFGETKLEAMGKGLSSAEATLVGVLDAASTAFLESKMAEKYIPSVFGGAVKDATVSAARKGGTAFFSKVGALAKEFGSIGANEAFQENLENVVSGGIKAVAYGDVTELTNPLQPGQMVETGAMAFVTALPLFAEGKGINLIAAQQAHKHARTEQQQTQQEAQQQQESPETEQYAQTEQTSQEAQTEQPVQEAQAELTPTQENNVVLEADGGEAVQPMGTVSAAQQQAVQEAIARVIGSPEAMEQVVEARAAQIVNERVGLGELNTEQISQLTARAQETESALLTARNTQAEQRQELQRVQTILQKANQRAATKQGAKTISQYAPKAANLREALRVSNQQVQEAQQAYQTARQELQQARQAAYTQLQQQAMTQAQQEIQQAAELTTEAAITGDDVQEIQSQQQQADAVAQTSAQDVAQELKAARSAYYQARKQGKALQTQKQQLTAQLQGHLQAVRVAEQNGSDVSAFAQSLEQITGALTEVDKQIQQQAQVIKNARAEMNRLAAGGQENTQQTQEAQNAQNAPQAGQEAAQTVQMEQAAGQEEAAQNAAPEAETAVYTSPSDAVTGADGAETGERQWGRKGAQNTALLPQATKDYIRDHNAMSKDTNEAQINRALQRIESKGEAATLSEWLDMDRNAMGNPEAQAMGIVLMAQAAAKGDSETQIAVLNKVAEKYGEIGTTLGRGLQSRKILDMTTPAAAALWVQRLAKQTERRYSTPKQALSIELSQEATERILNAKTLEERQDAVDASVVEIAQQVPPSFWYAMNNVRFLCMLGNPRTHVRNIFGNIAMIPLSVVRDSVSGAAQKLLKPENRTRIISPVAKQEYRDFARSDYTDAAVTRMLRGEPKYQSADAMTSVIERERPKFWDNWLGHKLGKVDKGNSAVLRFEDMLFKSLYYKKALAGYLQAKEIDLATISPQQLQEAREFAVQEAQVNTFHNPSFLASALANLENYMKRGGPFATDPDIKKREFAKKVGTLATIPLEGRLPFKSVPVNVAARAIEYSPVGVLKSVIWDAYALHKGGISLPQFIDRVSSGLTGTGVALVGALLGSSGLLNLTATASLGDDDEDKFKKANGYQEYAINVETENGTVSYTIDWLGPMASALFSGVEMAQAFGDDANVFQAISDTASRLTGPITDLTFLDGMSDLFSTSYNSDKDWIWNLTVGSVENYLSQYNPTILGQIARTIDPVRRMNYTDKNSSIPTDMQYAINRQLNKLPFASKLSPAYVDIWGKEEINESLPLRIFENFFSPGYINYIKSDEATKLIEQVAEDAGPDDAVYPKAAAKSFRVNKQTVQLTSEQWTQYQTALGELTEEGLKLLAESPTFAGLEPAYQAKAIEKVIAYNKKAAQRELYPEIEIPSWAKDAKSMGEVVDEAVASAHKSLTTDYAKGLAAEIASTIAQPGLSYDDKMQSCTVLMSGFRNAQAQNPELTDKVLRTQLKSAIKDDYIEAWNNGDLETASEFVSLADDLGLEITEKEFRTWIPESKKEK